MNKDMKKSDIKKGMYLVSSGGADCVIEDVEKNLKNFDNDLNCISDIGDEHYWDVVKVYGTNNELLWEREK